MILHGHPYLHSPAFICSLHLSCQRTDPFQLPKQEALPLGPVLDLPGSNQPVLLHITSLAVARLTSSQLGREELSEAERSQGFMETSVFLRRSAQHSEILVTCLYWPWLPILIHHETADSCSSSSQESRFHPGCFSAVPAGCQ